MPQGIYPRTPEQCAKISATLKGHKASDETRRKMSEAHSAQPRVKRNSDSEIKRQKIIRELVVVHGRVCWYCGTTLTKKKVWQNCTIEHIIPKSLSGGDDFNNLALACSICNRAKYNLPVEEFLEWLAFVRSSASITRFRL